jgi:S-adenosylmethionine synthetase
MRATAKNIVAPDWREVRNQVAHAIGVARPVSILVRLSAPARSPRKLASGRDHFDLRPKGIIHALNLLRPIYFKTAAYGHFGRDEPEFTWEATDKVPALKADAGIK